MVKFGRCISIIITTRSSNQRHFEPKVAIVGLEWLAADVSNCVCVKRVFVTCPRNVAELFGFEMSRELLDILWSVASSRVGYARSKLNCFHRIILLTITGELIQSCAIPAATLQCRNIRLSLRF